MSDSAPNSRRPAEPAAPPAPTPASAPAPAASATEAENANPPAAALTPEEQMERFAKDLKENDWGHQPC